jgi:post-segregation antitoxin (ccd killing protein)
MSTLNLRLSESLHRQLAELAKSEGVSINQLIATAAAEKLAALTTQEYLQGRARRASPKKFKEALATVPRVAPLAGDELPPGYRRGSLKKRSRRAKAS